MHSCGTIHSERSIGDARGDAECPERTGREAACPPRKLDGRKERRTARHEEDGVKYEYFKVPELKDFEEITQTQGDSVHCQTPNARPYLNSCFPEDNRCFRAPQTYKENPACPELEDEREMSIALQVIEKASNLQPSVG